MKYTILEIYGYLVCFIALSIGVISLGVGMYSLVEISAPGYMLFEKQVQKHRDNETFAHSYYKSDIYKSLTDEHITAQRTESLKIAIDNQQKNAVKRLIGAVIVILINIVVFIIHWRIVEKVSRKQ